MKRVFIVVIRNQYSHDNDIERVISAHRNIGDAEHKAHVVGGEVITVEVDA